MEIATVIRVLYGTFITSWREIEALEEKGRAKRLLISNASHDGLSVFYLWGLLLTQRYFSLDSFEPYYQSHGDYLGRKNRL